MFRAFILQAIRASLESQLPAEPPADCKAPMARIRFRCPGGELLNRRFLGSETLQVLLNYVSSKGYDTSDYKVLTTYPRRDVSHSSLYFSGLFDLEFEGGGDGKLL